MSWHFSRGEFSHLSHLCNGHGKKHYPTSQDLLFTSFFPYLAQNPAFSLWRCVCTLSASGWLLCAWSTKHLLLLQVFDSSTMSIPVPHKYICNICIHTAHFVYVIVCSLQFVCICTTGYFQLGFRR